MASRPPARRAWARAHAWLGALAAPLILLESCTVLLLNHQAWYFDRATRSGPAWLLRLAYGLHDGWFWGQPAGVLLTDAVAIALMLLVASGLILAWKIPAFRAQDHEP